MDTVGRLQASLFCKRERAQTGHLSLYIERVCRGTQISCVTGQNQKILSARFKQNVRPIRAPYVGADRGDHYRSHILPVETYFAGLPDRLRDERPERQDQYVGLSAQEADILTNAETKKRSPAFTNCSHLIQRNLI